MNRTSSRQQRGVALALLLWFIAALALLVSGIMYQVKTDLRLSQWTVKSAQAQALADGASNLALYQPLQVGQLSRYQVEVDQHVIEVALYPVSGLIDLNSASAGLLQALFSYGAGLTEPEATQLTERVLEWRNGGFADKPAVLRRYQQAGSAKLPRFGRFEAPEDLLQVQGVSRTIYQQIQGMVYAQQTSHAGVNLAAAPLPVLRVLAKGDEALAEQWDKQRAQFLTGFLPPELEPEWINRQNSTLYCSQARVTFADGEHVQRIRWIDRARKGVDGLPWAVVRAEPAYRLPTEENREAKRRAKENRNVAN